MLVVRSAIQGPRNHRSSVQTALRVRGEGALWAEGAAFQCGSRYVSVAKRSPGTAGDGAADDACGLSPRRPLKIWPADQSYPPALRCVGFPGVAELRPRAGRLQESTCQHRALERGLQGAREVRRNWTSNEAATTPVNGDSDRPAPAVFRVVSVGAVLQGVAQNLNGAASTTHLGTHEPAA